MKRPTYTHPSIIKKVFRPGERSLPRNEIIKRLEESLQAAGYNQESEALLSEILRKEQSPVRVGSSEAIIELTYQPHQLFDLAYRFLRDTHTPKTLEQIVPELRRQTQFSWNQVMRLLQLERDPRFVQYQGDKRWFLSDWKLANDQIYQYACEHGVTQISARTIFYFIELEVGLSSREYVFLPELDDRFRLEGETLHIVIQPDLQPATSVQVEPEAETAAHVERESAADAEMEPEPLATVEVEQESTNAADAEPKSSASVDFEPEAAIILDGEANELTETAEIAEQTFPDVTEVAAALETAELHEQLSFEEEPFMNTTNQLPSVLTEVNQLLRQALARLETRNREMSQDVIVHFQKNDMQAIEQLLKEKQKNEQIALGIQQVLSIAEQQ
jgi:hypothetical protein